MDESVRTEVQNIIPALSPVLVEVADINVTFSGKHVLDGVSLKVKRGEIVTIIGPNGAGKSTLIRVILGLLKADGGIVTRRKGLRIGYMPQRMELDPALPLTVEKFLALAVPRGSEKGRKRIASVLEDVGAETVLEQSMQDLSGGERQRVMLARALLREPDLLVLDEPSQGVDIGGQADLYRLIGSIRDQRGCGVLLVSHDLHLVMAATDQVVCINTHVCCAGHPETVTRDPAYVDLFGDELARAFAVYHHHHDHHHADDGKVVPLPESEGHSDHG
ncbi:MAG: zinc ABC transporter ATP-binding protein ZnuC [Rhodospirillales bacterium]|nr:zinc ABC transporter ATP-binding protein ZnuC [Rhodospirillales bacterium]